MPSPHPGRVINSQAWESDGSRRVGATFTRLTRVKGEVVLSMGEVLEIDSVITPHLLSMSLQQTSIQFLTGDPP